MAPLLADGVDGNATPTQLLIHDPCMPQRTDDQLLRIPVRDIETFGELAGGEVLVVMKAQHFALGGVEALEDAADEELALDAVGLGGYDGLRDGVEACTLDIVHTRSGAPVGAACIADRADQEAAG